jgi:hypothetical protein
MNDSQNIEKNLLQIEELEAKVAPAQWSLVDKCTIVWDSL